MQCMSKQGRCYLLPRPHLSALLQVKNKVMLHTDLVAACGLGVYSSSYIALLLPGKITRQGRAGPLWSAALLESNVYYVTHVCLQIKTPRHVCDKKY
jgi:hypothetical protein